MQRKVSPTEVRYDLGRHGDPPCRNVIRGSHTRESYAQVQQGLGYPDFSECFSDGETVEEAIANGRDALRSVIEALEAKGLPVPEPASGGTFSGRFVQRVPKSVHAHLAERAKAEGVSLKTLVLAFIAEGLGSGHRDKRVARARLHQAR